MDQAAQRTLLRRYAVALARLIRALHDRNLTHRDLKAANILIEGDPLAVPPHLSLIDLVGVDLHRRLPPRKTAQNLARLHLSLLDAPGRTRTDALRFLFAYLPARERRDGRWKRLARRVARIAARKVAQNQRRGRPLS